VTVHHPDGHPPQDGGKERELDRLPCDGHRIRLDVA
jgi:hypothetical protein